MVTVECSANLCRFKNNDGYYGICKNPKQQKEYRLFAGGRVKVSGCECAECESGCSIVPVTVD